MTASRAGFILKKGVELDGWPFISKRKKAVKRRVKRVRMVF